MKKLHHFNIIGPHKMNQLLPSTPQAIWLRGFRVQVRFVSADASYFCSRGNCSLHMLRML